MDLTPNQPKEIRIMKYTVTKTDGSPVSPNARYFVLRLDKPDHHGQICRRVVALFSEMILAHSPEAAKAALDAIKEGQQIAYSRHLLSKAGELLEDSK